jgi:P2-related tail formation protein
MTTEKYDLEDVLDAVMLAESQPSHEALLRWMKRYPKFGKQLENFFVAWSESEMRQHLSDTVEIDDEAITERAVKRVLAKLQRYERARP